MPHQTLILQSPLAPDALRARLAGATVDAVAAYSLRPQTVEHFMQSAQGRSFTGRLSEDSFKLRLIGEASGRWYVKRGQAILLGTIAGSRVTVHLRPPLFNLVFIALWCSWIAVVFALSYFGPAVPMSSVWAWPLPPPCP